MPLLRPIHRRRRTLVLAAIAVSAAAVGIYVAFVWNVPRLVITAHPKPFVVFVEDGPARLSCRVRNDGHRPVRLRVPKTSCSCLTGVPPAEPVLPGASAEIHFVLDHHGRPGRKSHHATIAADADIREHRINVEGDVKRRVCVDPPVLNIREVAPHKTVRSVITLTPDADPTRFRVTVVESPDPRVTCRAAATQPESSERCCEVEIVGSDVPGEIASPLIIRTDHPAAPVITVPLYVSFPGAWRLEPPALHFGGVLTHASAERHFTLASRDGAPFSLRVRTERPFTISVDPTPDSPADRFKAVVRMQAPEAPGKYRWSIGLETSLPGGGRIELPVTAEIKPRP